MNSKDQATQQSIQNYNQINKVVNPAKEATFFQDYWTKGFKLGRFEERNDFFQPVARFTNFLTEQFIEAPLSAPKTISEGVGEAQKGRYYSAAGKIGTGIIDLASIIPVVRGAKIATTAPKLTKAITTGAKEGAAYGGAYGLFEGLEAAQDVKPEDRLGVITESTLKGTGAGALLGAGIPTVVGGGKKLYKYFFPDTLPQVTKALDTKFSSIVKEAEDLRNRPNIGAVIPEIKPTETVKQPIKKLRAALPTIKKDITEANIQYRQVGKQIVQEAEVAAKSAGKQLSKVNPAIKAKAENIITNLAANNKDGALEIAANLDIEQFGKTVKFLESLRDKGNFTPQARAELDDYIKTSLETKSTPRESTREFNAVSNAVEKMDSADRNNFAKTILDIFNRTNNYIYENGIDPSQRPYLLQNAINSFYIDTFGPNGNAVEYIDAIAAKFIAEGNVSLGKRLYNTTGFMRKGYGQGIESAKRSLPGQIDQANEALNILRGAKNSELNKQINTATEDITNEITNQIETLIDSGATQKQIMSYVNKVMTENFGKDWDKKTKPLLLKELPFDTLARKIEDLAKRIPRDSVQIKEQEVIDAMVRQLYVIAKDTIKAPINPSNPDSIYKTLRTALSNKAKYKQVWEKAKNRVMETYKNDEEAYAILQDYFARNVPDVFKESQAQKAYRNLIKEDGVRFNQLVREHFTSQIETRDGLTLKLQAKLGLPQAQAADLSSKIYQYFNTNLEGARRAAIDRIITPIIRNPKQKKDVIDTIVEYSNLGIFNNVDYANAVASKLGLPHLTDENAQFIAKTMDRLQKGEIDNETALREIAEDISKANKLDFINNPGDRDIFLRSYFYNNIFSSFQTWERNLLGGLVNAFIVRPSLVAGERITANIFKTAGKELPEGIVSLPKGELGQYYKQLFGNIGNASNRFMEVMKNPNFIARTDNPTVRYYFDKGRENQLPKLFTTIGRFMEALDQFNATLIMNAEENLMRNRGFSPEIAREKAFAVSQELLGRASFGKGFQRGDFSSGRFKQKIQEEGWIDPFFDTIGTLGYKLRGSGGFTGFATTAILPVIRIAINLQKLKTKLFLPTQVLNVLAKDPANRKLQDYGYLVASGFTTAFAIDKFFKGEVEFTAPRDEKARQLFFDSGKKPYSVKIGNTYVPFQYLEVFGAPFLAMGAIKAAFQDNPDALNQNVIEKTTLALGKFAEAYFVSPTYLSTIANIFDSYRQINGKDWTQALAYPSTGLVPFSGLLRDLADIYDPIRRKKTNAWDEFKALYAPLKQELEPLRDTNLRPVELNTSELYAPYGIGTANPEREVQYDKRIQELQQTKFRQSQLKDEKTRVTNAKTELEMALRSNDIRFAEQVIREQKLTPAEVSSVTNKIKEDEAKTKLTSEELGLYGLTKNELDFLVKQNPELKPLVSKVSSFKQDFTSSQQNVFENLQSINKQPTKTKVKKARAKKFRIKKVKSKKFKLAKSKTPKVPKVKKLKAVRSQRI
jgi:hypothetical protein